MSELRPALRASYRLQYEDAQQGWVLLYPEGMVRLNGSAAEILRRCDGTRAIGAIVADLEQTFARGGLRADVDAFLEIAQRQRWVSLS